MDLHEVMKSLGRIEAKQESMQTDIADIKEGVADYRRLKNRLIGACAAISVTVGAAWEFIARQLGNHG